MIGIRAWSCSKSLREDFLLLSHLSYLELAVLILGISTLCSEVRPSNAAADGSPRLLGAYVSIHMFREDCPGSSVDLIAMNF